MLKTFSEAAHLAGVSRQMISKMAHRMPRELFFIDVDGKTFVNDEHPSWALYLQQREFKSIDITNSGMVDNPATDKPQVDERLKWICEAVLLTLDEISIPKEEQRYIVEKIEQHYEELTGKMI